MKNDSSIVLINSRYLDNMDDNQITCGILRKHKEIPIQKLYKHLHEFWF